MNCIYYYFYFKLKRIRKKIHQVLDYNFINYIFENFYYFEIHYNEFKYNSKYFECHLISNQKGYSVIKYIIWVFNNFNIYLIYIILYESFL